MINTPDDLNEDGTKALLIIQKFLTERGVDDERNDSKVFWSPVEWRTKGEVYGTESVLIVMYDGSHVRNVFSMDACYEMLHYLSYEPYEALQGRLNEAGFFFEECTRWYAAVYRV